MVPQSPPHQGIQEDGKHVRTITTIDPINEEGNQDDCQQPRDTADDPSIMRPEIQIASQQSEISDSGSTESAEPSLPAKSSPAIPTSEPSTTSCLGRPSPSSKHYYLKEMWPRQPICILCYKEYKKTNRAIRALPYGSIFHRACIDHLLGQKDGRCPSCDSSIPAEWNTPHKNDPMKLAGSPCLCHLASKAGTTTKTNTKNKGPSSTSYNILALQKVYKRTMKAVSRCTSRRKPKKLYSSYTTEIG